MERGEDIVGGNSDTLCEAAISNAMDDEAVDWVAGGVDVWAIALLDGAIVEVDEADLDFSDFFDVDDLVTGKEVTVGDWAEIDAEVFVLRIDFAFACPETTLEFMLKFMPRFFLQKFSLSFPETFQEVLTRDMPNSNPFT